MKIHIQSLTLLLLLTGTFPLTAQNELKPAKNVVTLREVFSKSGYPTGNQRYGSGFWGGVDLNGDSIGDFAIHQESMREWFFYAGGQVPDTALMWRLDSMSRFMYLGHLLNSDEYHIVGIAGYTLDIDRYRYGYDVPELYVVDEAGIRDEPIMTTDWGKQEPPLERTIRDIQVIDLNHDGYDDLCVAMSGYRIGHVPDSNHQVVRRGQIWIHLGGPDFSLEEPDVIVFDTTLAVEAPDKWRVRLGDFDGDGYADMLCGGGYAGVGEMLRFRWGDANSPQSWTERDFDRDIRLEHGKVGINTMSDLAIFDANGDGVADLGSFEYEDLQGNRIYLSGEGKDFRTRSFSIEDADIFYPNGHLLTFSAGFINDSTRRHEMMLLRNGSDIWGVSGSSTGPDFDYDARYSQGQLIPPFGPDSRGIRDVTGDGWDDFLGGDDAVANGAGTGLVLAGGPYIPFDDPTVSVREEPVAGVARGLFLWPNPVVNELHIAWRGDLLQMPDRFEIYSATGELLVEADATGSFGEMLWNCAGVPAGSYRLVVYDRENSVIASAPIIVQR